MAKSLSNDLRERLVSAVDGGMSRRTAAKRFGVAASTAIKWVDQWERTGGVQPRPQGGDHRSHHIEAYAEEILGLIEPYDMAATGPETVEGWRRFIEASRPALNRPRAKPAMPSPRRRFSRPLATSARPTGCTR